MLTTEKSFKACSQDQQIFFMLDNTDILTTEEFTQLLDWYYEARKQREFKEECAFYEANT